MQGIVFSGNRQAIDPLHFRLQPPSVIFQTHSVVFIYSNTPIRKTGAIRPETAIEPLA